MKSMTIIAFGALVAATQPAHAQGDATWLWSVSTQNGDAIVDPGETALVTLELLMDPRAVEPDMVAIAAVVFDTIGGVGADFGQIGDWTVLNNLAALTGDLTTTDGVSLFGTTAGQLPQQPGFVEDNPVAVLEFEWVPLSLGDYTVEYTTHSMTQGDHDVNVWIQGDSDEVLETWPVTEAAVSFQVIPAPASPLALAFLLWGRRRSCLRQVIPLAPPLEAETQLRQT